MKTPNREKQRKRKETDQGNASFLQRVGAIKTGKG